MFYRCGQTYRQLLRGSRCSRTWTWTLCLWLTYTCCSGTVQASGFASWYGARSALIRDSIFIEGGFLSLGNWSADASGYGSPTMDKDSFTGMLYRFDLSLAFDPAHQERSLIKTNYTRCPSSEDCKPGYAWGSMFVDANGFVLYGGLALRIQHDNSSSDVIAARLYPWPYDDSDRIQPIDSFIDPPVTEPPSSPNSSLWHRCCGSSASVPNGHQSFYFSGLISSTGGVLEYTPRSNETKVSLLANDMVMCNTTNLDRIECKSTTLPEFVKPRAEAALVWLPIGKQGSLILFGGVERPAAVFTEDIGDAANNTFMSDISIYDIATETWYQQLDLNPAPGPSQTASFCTAVAASKDGSSFNIYVYGGYDGTWANSNPLDDVWVLSLPSFTWVKVYDGSTTIAHGRQDHQCFSPYPNQMMVIGGTGSYWSPLTSPAAIDFFDMNKLVWTGTYDPLNWSDYKVPKVISDAIGGNEKGGIKLPISGLHPDISALFKTPYAEKIPIYYPYAKKTLTHYIRKTPEWIQIILVVLGYLTLSSAAFACVMLLWRRRYLKAAGLGGADLGPGHNIIAWSQGLLGKRTELPTKSNGKDNIEPLTIPYFDEIDNVSTQTRVSTDGSSTRTTRRSEQNFLFNEVELRTFISSNHTN